jgi:glycosyl-4,4'-diaponeurosporenoate acyltransferase
MAMTWSSAFVRVLGSSCAWFVLSLIVGWSTHHLSSATLRRWERVFALARFEAGGRPYDRYLAIRRWKKYLPEGGGFFEGGVSKRHLRRRDRAVLEQFVLETERAELTHWILLIVDLGPILWMKQWLLWVVLGYTVLANLPCLITQRYNRARLVRYLSKGR